jgi:CDP-diacylglycerol--glycerol-3-phosphate 3-phosphatidyltransferase
MAAAVIVTIITGLDYVGRALRLRAAAKRPLP